MFHCKKYFPVNKGSASHGVEVFHCSRIHLIQRGSASQDEINVLSILIRLVGTVMIEMFNCLKNALCFLAV